MAVPPPPEEVNLKYITFSPIPTGFEDSENCCVTSRCYGPHDFGKCAMADVTMLDVVRECNLFLFGPRTEDDERAKLYRFKYLNKLSTVHQEVTLRMSDEKAFGHLKRTCKVLRLLIECHSKLLEDKSLTSALDAKGFGDLSGLEEMAVAIADEKKRRALEDKKKRKARSSTQTADDDEEWSPEDDDEPAPRRRPRHNNDRDRAGRGGGAEEEEEEEKDASRDEISIWDALMQEHGGNLAAVEADARFGELKMTVRDGNGLTKVDKIRAAHKRIGDNGNGLLNYRYAWCAHLSVVISLR